MGDLVMTIKTIDELMEGQKPGTIKITRESWENGKYFVPYFKDDENFWWGLTADGNTDWQSASTKRWITYAPPKKKVKMWQWLIKDAEGYHPTERYYTAEDIEPLRESTILEVIQHLPHTEIEVEID
jgi:hypothetical protein